MSLSKDIVRSMYSYKEGKLFWKMKPNRRVNIGSEVGGLKPNGYIETKLNGKSYGVHRLIWIWHYGHIANKADIDHINRDKSDNRIENLRSVSHQHNLFNTVSKGYTTIKENGKVLYVARIGVNGKMIHLGRFLTAEEAHKAYLKAKEKYHVIKEI